MLTRVPAAPWLALALLVVAALHLVPLPERASRARPTGAESPALASRETPEDSPEETLEEAHAARRAGRFGAAEDRYAAVAADPRASAMLREEATYWSLHVRLAVGDPLARAALAGFLRRARSPDVVLRAAGLACAFARDADERRRASAAAHDALRARAEAATRDGARWRAALARLAERAESTEDFFREKSGKALHSGTDCP